MAGRDRQHRACIGIKVVGVPSRQGAGVVLRANAEFVLPLLMMVSHVTEQSILPLRLFVAVKVSAEKHWVEGIAVVDVVDAQRRAPASLKKCADEPVEVRTSCRCQSKLLAINTVVDILLQQIKWDRFLVEICISAIVGRKKGTQRSKCDLGVYRRFWELVLKSSALTWTRILLSSFGVATKVTRAPWSLASPKSNLL